MIRERIRRLSQNTPGWLKIALFTASTAAGGVLAVHAMVFGCQLLDWLLIVVCTAGFALAMLLALAV